MTASRLVLTVTLTISIGLLATPRATKAQPVGEGLAEPPTTSSCSSSSRRPGAVLRPAPPPGRDVRSSPQKIIAQGMDWHFINQLKKELKG